jgi:hypothetical protein
LSFHILTDDDDDAPHAHDVLELSLTMQQGPAIVDIFWDKSPC